jgi:hypothetical protein
MTRKRLSAFILAGILLRKCKASISRFETMPKFLKNLGVRAKLRFGVFAARNCSTMGPGGGVAGLGVHAVMDRQIKKGEERIDNGDIRAQ